MLDFSYFWFAIVKLSHSPGKMNVDLLGVDFLFHGEVTYELSFHMCMNHKCDVTRGR